MSHFTVLVVGQDPEKSLAPFQENNMGDCPKKFMKWKGWKEGEGTQWFDTKNEAVAYSGNKEEVSQGNPNAKWDWYALGGRWTGFFRLKPDGEGQVGKPGLMTERAEKGLVDSALKKYIDFPAMRAKTEQEAGELWDKIAKMVEGTPVNESWETIREREKATGFDGWMDMARAKYAAQPRVKAYEAGCAAEKMTTFYNPVDDYNIPREDYVKAQGIASYSTFAVLKDGVWYEKGKMGWFAYVHNENNNWQRDFEKLLDSVGDEELLSVYDCHI